MARRSVRSFPLCLLIGGLALLSGGCQQHEGKHADKHAHEHVVYQIGYHEGQEHKEDKLDAKNPRLIELIKEGKIEHLEVHKEFNVLDVLRYDLGLWAVVVFLLLFLILNKVAWGPMLEGLQKREQTIRAAVEEAKEARKETERVRAEFKAEMDKAYSEIPKMMEGARRDAQNLAEEMRAKALTDIQAERQRLRREIETARDQALQELWNKAAELATLISAKAIRRSLSEDDHRRLLDEALNELRDRERRSA